MKYFHVLLFVLYIWQSIPESLTARLLNVIVLDVHSNQLKFLPNSIGCLSKLKVLNVSGNLLQSFPRTIENCRFDFSPSSIIFALLHIPRTMHSNFLTLSQMFLGLAINPNITFVFFFLEHVLLFKVLAFAVFFAQLSSLIFNSVSKTKLSDSFLVILSQLSSGYHDKQKSTFQYVQSIIIYTVLSLTLHK